MQISVWHFEAPKDLLLFNSDVEYIPRVGEVLQIEDDEGGIGSEEWEVVKVAWDFGPLTSEDSEDDGWRTLFGANLTVRPIGESRLPGLVNALAEAVAIKKAREEV